MALGCRGEARERPHMGWAGLVECCPVSPTRLSPIRDDCVGQPGSCAGRGRIRYGARSVTEATYIHCEIQVLENHMRAS
eukprot:3941993-Rhodomonas_salina.1